MSQSTPDVKSDTLAGTDTHVLPPYRVILHNDDVNDMLRVVQVICNLTPLGPEEAIERMLEAHHTGYALLLVTHKERAELYVEQFASCRLTVTAEPDV
ncbi:MAG: ATP-dependent Clp protease adaptor ClpS [Phycisphaerae bacterium]|nr:ATP-dependent Clp protease adaptor ClpS [Phycisphaerae bacterium]